MIPLILFIIQSKEALRKANFLSSRKQGRNAGYGLALGDLLKSQGPALGFIPEVEKKPSKGDMSDKNGLLKEYNLSKDNNAEADKTVKPKHTIGSKFGLDGEEAVDISPSFKLFKIIVFTIYYIYLKMKIGAISF